MYKNFNITESEKEQILNRLKENGYGQPINEQKSKPSQIGGAAQELVKKLNMLKEFLGVYLSGVGTYISKTHPEYGVFMNNKRTQNELNNQSPKSFRSIFLQVKGSYYITNYVNFSVGTVGNADMVSKVGEENKPTIVYYLTHSKDLNELYQNLNKYPAETYAKVQTTYGIPDLVIEFYNQPSQAQPLHEILNNFENKENDIKVFESIYPDFKKTLYNMYEYTKLSGINNARNEMYKDRNDNSRITKYETLVDYYKKEDDVIKNLLGMNPTAPAQPIQGQPTQPQPQPQKPLNEGQEILKDVFKSLLK
jgi:thiol-disulfide isomerase/thioredoxin